MLGQFSENAAELFNDFGVAELNPNHRKTDSTDLIAPVLRRPVTCGNHTGLAGQFVNQ